MPAETLTLILASHRGEQLDPLTLHRPKPAIPFGGKYRIIDLTLANCLHSGLKQILVLTQYKSHSLHKHLRDGWAVFNPELGEYITAVPPQQREGLDWYQGPFDAIRQNRYLIERSGARQCLVLDGGAIYRMDYAEMIRAHRDSGAEVTIAVRGSSDPGSGPGRPLVDVDGEGRILSIRAPLGEAGAEALSTMGVFCLDTDWLLEHLTEPAEQIDRDLALDRIAPVCDRARVMAYRFGEARGRVTPDRYWCDLSGIDAYYDANMALLRADPPMDLYQPDWNIRTYQGQYPPARTVPGAGTGTEGIFVNSMLAAGTVICGGGVNHSILFPRVLVGDGAIVDTSILFDGVRVGEGAHLRDCIVDKDVVVPPREQIGMDRERDRDRFPISERGIVVVPKGFRF